MVAGEYRVAASVKDLLNAQSMSAAHPGNLAISTAVSTAVWSEPLTASGIKPLAWSQSRSYQTT